MATISPDTRHLSWHHTLLLSLLLGLGLAAASAASVTPASLTPITAGSNAGVKGLSQVTVRTLTISYRAHTGDLRHAIVLLPSWYTPQHNPPLPLVISPHGRGAGGRYNAQFWGTLPTTGGFAVVNPDGMGRRYVRYSYGDPGQIDDLARMPDIVARALRWVHIDRHRIFALGSSMGGQETLLLVARHPELLAGAAAMDSVTDLIRRYGQLPLIAGGRDLQSMMRKEVGGTPAEKPRAYAARSPLSLANAIAQSNVPLQIWWSKVDRIVIDQAHQSGALFRLILHLQPRAEVKAYIGHWRHSSEMRSSALLPLALVNFGLLPQGFEACPAAVQQRTAGTEPAARALGL
jgi:pimeloyl-ACP methyl ester carboxylesterase